MEGGGNRKSLLNGYRVPVFQEEKSSRVGDGVTTTWTVHLKMVKMINFMSCVFYHN